MRVDSSNMNVIQMAAEIMTQNLLTNHRLVLGRNSVKRDNMLVRSEGHLCESQFQYESKTSGCRDNSQRPIDKSQASNGQNITGTWQYTDQI